MSIDKAKIHDAARKFVERGAFDRAVGEYERILAADPMDARIWMELARVHQKREATPEALKGFHRAAELYSKQGFSDKAVAVYKQVLAVDSENLQALSGLAVLYEQLGLVRNAVASYEQIAAAYARRGDMRQAVEALGAMVRIEPDSVPSRIKYAEALSREERSEEAADAFAAGAALLKQQGRVDDYLKVAERMLFHRPDDVMTSRELAVLYLERDDPKRALAKLQACFKADPKDVQTLELLAEAFHRLGQLPKTVSVLREVAKIHGEANRRDQQRHVLAQILELDPGDTDARRTLTQMAETRPPSDVRSMIAPPPGAVVVADAQLASANTEGPSIEVDIDSGDLSLGSDNESLRDVRTDPPSAFAEDDIGDEEEVYVIEDDESEPFESQAGLERSRNSEPFGQQETSESFSGARPDSNDKKKELDKLLAEADVFKRYGLKHRVVDQLRKAYSLSPEPSSVRERLIGAIVERGEVEGVSDLLAFADGQPDDVRRQFLEGALRLDPSDLDVQRALGLGPEDAHQIDDVEPNVNATHVLSKDLLAQLRKGQSRRSEPPVSAIDTTDLTASAADVLKRVSMFSDLPAMPDDEVVEEPKVGGSVEATVFFVDEAAARLSEPAARAVVPSVPPDPAEFDADIRRRSSSEAPRASVQGLGSEVEDVLEEADFYFAQGMLGEARVLLEDSLQNFPSHPLLSERLRETLEALSARKATRTGSSASLVLPEVKSAPLFTTPVLNENSLEERNVGTDDDEWSRASLDGVASVPMQALTPFPPPRAAGSSDHGAPDPIFALAEELAGDFDALPPEATDVGASVLDVESVFAQFKKGVDKQLGADDLQTRFDLGIAYKEMGLLKDALAEFQLCLKLPEKECAARTMMGLCWLEIGDASEAIQQFKRGLYADRKNDADETALYFELGNAYEVLGDLQEAVFYFEKVKKRDIGFRSVEGRIKALQRTSIPPQPAAEPIDDIDAAFSNLIDD